MADESKVILTVDDDPDIRDFFKMVLEAEGYTVVQAETAEEGFTTFKEANPDLVFVDLMMEEIDAGRSLVKEIHAAGSNVPIYMVTSVGDAMNLNTSYTDLGVQGVLQKPVDTKMLLKLVNQALED